MAQKLLEKLFNEAYKSNASYVTLTITEGNVAYTSDGGSRKSTKNFRQNAKEVKEIEKQLKTFNEKNILFAGNLRKMSFSLTDGRTASFESKVNDDFVLVKAKRVTEINTKFYEFIRFASLENNTGIAFMVKNGKNGRKQIEPCEGVILNGALPSGLDTDLQFVVSCELQVIDGELDSRFEKDNAEIIDHIAQILKIAIGKMPLLKLQGMPLFSVLPSSLDEESVLNEALIEATKNVCNSAHLFYNRVGTIVNRSKVMMGADEVTRIFPQEIYDCIFAGNRYWLEPCQSGSREEYFLIDLGIPYFDREKFIRELFDESNFDGLMDVLTAQKDKWLREFYIFCAKHTEEDITRRRLISGFKNIRSIRDSKGKMRYPYEVSIVADDVNTSKDSVVIKESLLAPGGKNDEYTELLREFFVSEIGIGTFSQKPEIEQLASDLAGKKQSIDDKYCEKLMKLVEFDCNNPSEIDFAQYAVFPYESSRGISRALASEIVIGKPYVKEGNLIAASMDRPPLWKGLKKLLDEESIQQLIAFAEKYGAVGMPVVICQTAEKHSDFSKLLYVEGRRTNRDTNFDYYIPGLDELLKRRSLQLSRLVWQAITSVEYPQDVLYAEYSSENRQNVNRCDSSLIQILRQRTWVPDKENKLHTPEDIAMADISDDFKVDRKNPIIKQLNFGAGVKRREQQRKDLEKLVAKEGYRLVRENEYQEFLNWKRKYSNMGTTK